MLNTPKENNNPVTRDQIEVRRPLASDLWLTPFIILILLIFISVPASAQTVYYNDITPKNNLFELSVHPGDTLLQGRSYDLIPVYGFTGSFAHWNSYQNQGLNCNPDYIINTSYIGSNGRNTPKNVYLDPSRWPRGDWFQWEGCFEVYSKGQNTGVISPYTHDNSLVFTVINYYQDFHIIQSWEAARAITT